MDKTRICSDCGEEFSNKPKGKGRINQCSDCSASDETNRYIGYNNGELNKSQSIAVYRGDNPQVKKTLLGFRMV